MSHNNELPTFDPQTLHQLKELVDGEDTSFLGELFESYLATADENIQTLRHELDGTLLRRAAHTLKGSSLSVGAARVADLCRQLEQALNATPPADISQRVALIEKQVQHVTDEYPAALAELVRNGSTQ